MQRLGRIDQWYPAEALNIHESTTMKISAMAKKLTASGLDIIDMGVGEPDFDTPKHIVRRAAAPSNGRDALCSHSRHSRSEAGHC